MFTFRSGFYLPLFPTWVQIPHILSQVCAVLKDVPLGHSFWVWVTVGLVSDFWLQEMRAPSSLQLLEWKSWSFYFYWQVSGNGRMEGAAFTLPVFQGDHLWCEIRLVNKKIKSKIQKGIGLSIDKLKSAYYAAFLRLAAINQNLFLDHLCSWQCNKYTELRAAQAVRCGAERLWMKKLQQCLRLESFSYNNGICQSVLEMGLHFQLISISFTKINRYQCSQTCPPIYGA